MNDQAADKSFQVLASLRQRALYVSVDRLVGMDNAPVNFSNPLPLSRPLISPSTLQS